MNACPLTTAFISTLHNLYDFNSVANEYWLEPLKLLEERAEVGGDNRERQHHRGFLCIELMTTRLAPKLSHNILDKQYVVDLMWPRTREGLNQMIKVLHDDHFNLLGAVIEYTYDRSTRRRGIEEMTFDNQHRLVEVYKLARESAVILRQSLKNPNVALMRVGKRLALAAHTARLYVSDMLVLGSWLLEETEHKATRAWDLPKT